jgi:UDP-N-acetylmuramoyl-tripeptide--D-alanyl-D-alanine ligase
MMFTVQEAAQMIGARLVAPQAGAGEGVCQAVSTDSRALKAGDLFVALRGDRFDGHAYLTQVAQQGAVAAIVDVEQPAPLPQLVVDDTRRALGRLATEWRRRFVMPTIAVTGSNGKTTTKEMIAAVLAAHVGADCRLATRGNFNNDIGVPLTLLRLSRLHRFAVIEIGMNHPGETEALAAMAQPTVALVNNAQREHQEFMQSVEAVAREHALAIRAVPATGAVVFPADDPHAAIWRQAAEGRSVWDFALTGPAAVTAEYELDDFGSRLRLFTAQGEAPVALNAAGLHNVRNAMAATAATLAAGVPLSAVVRGLESFRPAAGRLQKKQAAAWTLIDDTYNANPDSVRAAIEVLARQRAPRFLVLGDMGETGYQGPAFHREIGAFAKERGVDRLFALGRATPDAVAAFGEGAEHFSDIDGVLAALRKLDAHAATVLVKGSRFMGMERIVQALTGVAGEGGH